MVVGALLGQTLRQTLHRTFAGRFVGRRGHEREALLGMARAHEALVEVYYLRDASLPCLHSALRGLNLAELAGPSPELARSYATVGAIVGFVPLPRMAEAYCRRALDTAREAGDVSAAVWTALTVGAYKLGVAAWDEAETLFDVVTSESERLGDARRWDDGIQFLTDLHLLRGRFETSLDLAERLYRSASQRNDPRGQASAVYRRVLCLLALARDDEISRGIEEILTLRWNVGTVHGDLPVRTLLGLGALRTGDTATAERVALEAAAMLETLVPAYHGYVFDAAGTVDVLLQLAERQDAAGEAGAARTRGLRSAFGALRRLARVFPIGRPWLALLQGRAERLRGRPEAALRLWRTTVALGERLEMPYPAALAHLELAAFLSSADPARDTHCRSARQLLTRLGAAHDLRRLGAIAG
jgi:tetratricopeptide (TPR) repeat protein